jgi:hypothetical protein
MNWKAFYLADGEYPHEIGAFKYRHQAAQGLRTFVARIPHPEIQIWWGWLEGPEGQRTTWEEIQQEDIDYSSGCPYSEWEKS